MRLERRQTDSSSSRIRTPSMKISPPRSLMGHGRSERRYGMGIGVGAGVGVGDGVGQQDRERPRRIIGDGNIYGRAPTGISITENYTDDAENTNETVEDNDLDIEAALALALPTSPITDSAPLRAAPAALALAPASADYRGSNVLREDVDPFQTGLGFGPGWEAGAAYLMLPPAGTVALLMLEHRSDYVRYVRGV